MNMDSVTADLAKLAMSAVIYLTMPLKLFPAIVIVESYFLGDPEDDVKYQHFDAPFPTSSLPTNPLMVPFRSSSEEKRSSSKEKQESVPDSVGPAADLSIPKEFTAADVVFLESHSCSPAADESEETQENDWPFVVEPKQILIRILLAS